MNYVCNIKIKFKIINKITSLAFFQLLNGSEDKKPSFWFPTPPHLAKTTQNRQNAPDFISEYSNQLYDVNQWCWNFNFRSLLGSNIGNE